MEYALWEPKTGEAQEVEMVLILILMEYALWVTIDDMTDEDVKEGLNPYSNGICSLRVFSFMQSRLISDMS